jgi:predicted AlkP superfamily phosphohydrolase/phosphomutase
MHFRAFGAAFIPLALVLCACRPARNSSQTRKLIVIGVDGMDPGFVERHWNSLPNLRKLKADGYFGRLETTTPPQSPVAWSSFITGLPPAQHGIFDFVHRDALTLQPFSSMGRTEQPHHTLSFGPYILPLIGGKFASLRKGTPFWQTLSNRGVDVSVVRMPTNYPPVESGRALSGMGTPDMQGTLGTFTFYTDRPEETPRELPGGRVAKVQLVNGHVTLSLSGPPNTLRRDNAASSVNIEVDVDPEDPVARFKVGNQLAVLKEGEWSGWVLADFDFIPHISSVRGTFRLYAKQLKPAFQLYVSALNADPVSPDLPVSYPAGWSNEIARETGRFFTLGTPEDTSALRQQMLTHAEFRQQSELVFADEKKLFQYSLRHYKDGLLFYYFSAVDQNSHVLWGRYDSELLDVYREVDECIGEVRRQIPDAQLVVMSDHGFTTFSRAANLNTWLLHRGFLGLQGEPGDDTGLNNIDWGNTRAYAAGLNGLYINLKGREAHGVIPPGEDKRTIMANLREQLLAWRDPASDKAVVSAVYYTNASPGNLSIAPDLIIGYGPGYRASWQTGIGGTPAEELENNEDAWIGDHCIDPVAVPGVFFSSSPTFGLAYQIKDVTALILSFFK